MGIGGGSSGSVPPASFSQPPRFPSSANTSGAIAGQYGRDATTLRGSLSVPAFSTYLKVDPPAESVANGASDVPVPPSLPPLQVNREGFPPRAPKPSKHSNGGNFASGNLPSSPSWWVQGKTAIGLFLTAVLLLYLGFLLGKSYWKTEALQYAIVIDGGSTGTRVHVYAWAHSPKDSLPVMVKPTYSRDDSSPWYRVPGQQRAYKRVETEPGLDKTLNNETAVELALQPLLDWAEKQIPPYARGSTRLFLLATAGLRRLPQIHSESILNNAFSVLQKSPFMCQRKWVKVISGVEEAYYGWIALNYNLGRLGHTPKLPNVGTLDLGGSSFQVTFEPEEVSREYGVNVSVGTTDHHLYAVSHAGYGLNDAFEKSVAQLLRPQASKSTGIVATSNGLVELEHPCLHRGYKKPYVCSTHCMLPPLAFGSQSDGLADRVAQVELIGGADWKACQALVEKVVNSSHTEKCASPSGCALGKYQPSPEGNFYGLAGFFVVYKFFGLKGNAPLGKLLKKGQKFCELNWKDAQAKVVSQPSIDQYCFRAPYIAALLRQGLHLRDNQVTIGSGDFAWTLGAALWEAGALIPVKTESEKTRVLANYTNSTRITVSIALLVLFLILGLITCYVVRILRPRRRSYLPRYNPLNSSPGGPHWIQLPLRAHGRLGSLTTNGFGRGDDVKMPHSPVPDAVHGLHNPVFGSMAFNGSSCDREGVQSSSPGMGISTPDRHQKSTGMMQYKGGYLQSRRTQSREDLSYYVSDPHGARV